MEAAWELGRSGWPGSRGPETQSVQGGLAHHRPVSAMSGWASFTCGLWSHLHVLVLVIWKELREYDVVRGDGIISIWFASGELVHV